LYDKSYAQLRQGTLNKLARAVRILTEEGYRLILWDAYRPLSVQKKLWDEMPDERFVAHPDKGSMHNRGCAVDASLAYADGKPCEMPTAFDAFGLQARSDRTDLTYEVLMHLKTLQNAMCSAGFETIEDEWWHFNDSDWQQYDLI
jgi:D-alanyl-D-alanine dipeptidase